MRRLAEAQKDDPMNRRVIRAMVSGALLGVSFGLVSSMAGWTALAGALAAACTWHARRHLSELLSGMVTAAGTAAAVGGLAKLAMSEPAVATVLGALVLIATPGALLADMTISVEGRRNGPATGAAAGILIGTALGAIWTIRTVEVLLIVAAPAAVEVIWRRWTGKQMTGGWKALLRATAVLWIASEAAAGRLINEGIIEVMGAAAMLSLGGLAMTWGADWAASKRQARE